MHIVVLSTFDIWPPRDGGQTRYVNIWKHLSDRHSIKLVVYDFRNLVQQRRYYINPNFEVIVPIASRHDAMLFNRMAGETGLWLHDVLCICNYVFSKDFMQCLADVVWSADVVVASHPYLAPIAFPFARTNCLKVYESHNVELDVKADYFKQGSNVRLLTSLLEHVRMAEKWATYIANKVTAVSHKDQLRFQQLYQTSPSKISIVPNGTNLKKPRPVDPSVKESLRELMGIGDGHIAVFLGSAYPGNVESYRQARLMLDESGFRGCVLVLGSIVEADRTKWAEVQFDERWLGFVEESVKDLVLGVADFAINLMFSGAGTNLKLFDYMASGVPIIANSFGSRGIDGQDWYIPVETAADLKAVISSSLFDNGTATGIAANAKSIVEIRYDWNVIGRDFEKLLTYSTSAITK